MSDPAGPADPGTPPPGQAHGSAGQGHPGSADEPPRAVWRRIIADTVGLRGGHRLQAAIALIDARLSAQLAEIMQAPRLLRLEATWRGLHLLVVAGEPCPLVKIRVLNITRRELFEDLTGTR